MNIFDIIGPIMVGPSSSHTAGAARIAAVTRKLLGEDVKNASIKLHGSFATTYKGHGTDRAIVGGLLGYKVDDPAIRESFKHAQLSGLTFNFEKEDLGDVHPNTALIEAIGVSGKKIKVMGCSVGGGRIMIKRIDNFPVEFTGQYYTLVIEYKDKPGVIASVTSILGRNSINIAEMRVYRSYRGGTAVMIIEADQVIEKSLIDQVKNIQDVYNTVGIDAVEV
ncbi:MAG TPA: L-serine ammonia-lyase, iron-sulfur-dependent subunit beta [Clostridiales bacterium]|nr:L-serine ammonia-lyase, iron-sulfur-dependent subunit beta [Clostridiales bacterium]